MEVRGWRRWERGGRKVGERGGGGGGREMGERGGGGGRREVRERGDGGGGREMGEGWERDERERQERALLSLQSKM